MENLRRSMPVVIVGMIVVFVLLIVFDWGNARRGGGAARVNDQSVGSVNGENISLTAYEERIQKTTSAQRENNPNAEVNDEQIREGVWNQMVEEAIIRQTAEKMGITLSDEQFREQLLYSPPDQLRQQFTDSSGVFQEAMYLEFMTNPDKFFTDRKYPAAEAQKLRVKKLDIEEYYYHDFQRQAVESAISATAVPSFSAALLTYKDQKTKISGSFAALDATLIRDSVTVSDQEAQAYFEAHKDNYWQKASRELRYAMFALTPSSQDSNAINRRIRTISETLAKAQTPATKDSLFAQFADQFGSGSYPGQSYTPLQQIPGEIQGPISAAKIGDVIGPLGTSQGPVMINIIDMQDSGETYVKASHILLKTGPGINEDSVKREAEKIYHDVKAGKSFELAASQSSQDPGSAQRGGDLGYFKKGAMVKEFDATAFATPVGSITEPFKSQFGYHIIKVLDRSSKQFKLRDIKLDIKPTNNTKNLLRRRAQEFRDKLTSDNVQIDTLGVRMKVQIIGTGPFTRSTPAGGSMKLTYFAYDGKVGDISDPVELQDGSLAVAQISAIHKQGPMSFAEARDQVVAAVRQAKKIAMLKDRMAKLRQSLAPGDSLGKLASLDSAVKVHSFKDISPGSPLPQVGFDFPLNAAVYTTLKPGTVSDPIKGERGYYIAMVDTRTAPSDADFAKERDQAIKQQITQKRSSIFQQWLQKQKESSLIEDFRNGRR